MPGASLKAAKRRARAPDLFRIVRGNEPVGKLFHNRDALDQ